MRRVLSPRTSVTRVGDTVTTRRSAAQITANTRPSTSPPATAASVAHGCGSFVRTLNTPWNGKASRLLTHAAMAHTPTPSAPPASGQPIQDAVRSHDASPTVVSMPPIIRPRTRFMKAGRSDQLVDHPAEHGFEAGAVFGE